MSADPLPRARLLLLTAAAATLAGCGDPPSPTSADRGAVAIEQRDYRFRPQSVRVTGERVRLTVTNRGRLPHALRLRLRGMERLSVPTVLPGRSRTVSARLKPGSYRMVCPIGNHEELGMYGVLVVR